MLDDEKRAGAALVRATKPFSEEIPSLTWRLFAITVLVYLASVGVAVFAPWWWLQLLAGVFTGAVVVRIFIFYHDYLHGAVFRDSRLGHALMVLYGLFVLAPAPVWRQTHDYHHQHNAKMLGAAIGSYPIVSVRMWHTMTASQRRWYLFARNPLTIVFGYFTTFIGGMCFAPFFRDPKVHWQGPLAVVLHGLLLAGVGIAVSPAAAFFGVFVPQYTACVLGSYLFYAQHNFPGCEIRSREAWTYHHAALRASSFFEMSAPLHWLTGNIGYHHVHHLNHKIPFYRLPEAMAAIPELQTAGRTSWRLSDIAACLRLKLWDPERNRLISWAELPPAPAAPPSTSSDVAVGGA